VPYLKIQSNHSLSEQQIKELLRHASTTVAEQLGKPESYVMVVVEPPVPMLFAGNDAPVVFMELKSIGLTESQTPGLSDTLCKLAHETMGVDLDRVYIEFVDAPRKMWGWNGRTF